MNINLKKIFRRSLSSKEKEYLEFLLKSQYWEKEEILEYQIGKMKKLLKYAYYRVPYYKKMFDSIQATPEDIKTFSHFAKLPVLTKSDIQKFSSDITGIDIDLSLCCHNSTGGSTGMPLNFYQGKQYIDGLMHL